MVTVLLWLVRVSGRVYWLHFVTLTVFTASESSLRRFSLVAASAYSDYVLLHVTNTLTYLLTYLFTDCGDYLLSYILIS